MILEALLTFAVSIVNALISILPNADMDVVSNLESAIADFISRIESANQFLPVHTILQVISVILAVEGAILSFKLAKWAIRNLSA